MQKKNENRGITRAGLFGYAFLVLLVVISFNTFLSALTDRLGLTVDLTQGQLFRLTQTTKEILSDLEKEVNIVYFDEEKGSDTNISELLKQYRKYSDRISLEFLDPASNPGRVRTYEEDGIAVSANSLVVESGENAAGISWSDLYTYNTYLDGNGNTKYTMTAFKAEKKITSAIVQVTGSEQAGVYFTEGHNENFDSGLTELVEDSHYRVEHGVLGMDKMPEGVTTIVIAGASRDFSGEEISRLDAFLAEGGNLIVFRDPKAGSLTRLDGFLKEWGLSVQGTVCMEPSRQMGSPINVIPDFSVHMINVYFSEASAYLVLPLCGGLELTSPNGRLTSPVLKSTASSYAKLLDDAVTTEKEESDLKGPFVLAATSEETKNGADGKPKTAHVFLADCSGFYEKQFLDNASLGNRQLVLQTLSYMNENSVTLDIPEKKLGNTQIAVSWSVTLVIGAVFLGVIPGVLLLMGLFIFIRRRRA